jgi:methylmalonyl-CoA/ethylmalonyl-CoA epimerase
MESAQPDSPVTTYLQTKGPGLERIALLSDDIEAEFERVHQTGVQVPDQAPVDTPTGRRFTIPAAEMSGVAVEVIQTKPGAWEHNAPRDISGVLGLQHVGVAVKDLQATIRQFGDLLDLQASDLRTDQHDGEQKDIMICPGNDRLWLHVTESWGENARVRHYLERAGQGLEHLCIEVDDIRHAVVRVTSAGVPLYDDKIFTNRPDGFEAFIYPEHSTGVTIELIEPYPSSRGYRPRRP